MQQGQAAAYFAQLMGSKFNVPVVLCIGQVTGEGDAFNRHGLCSYKLAASIWWGKLRTVLMRLLEQTVACL